MTEQHLTILLKMHKGDSLTEAEFLRLLAYNLIELKDHSIYHASRSQNVQKDFKVTEDGMQWLRNKA